MARVDFYEKPGCGTNARQKAMLAAAGHEVVVHNLLSEPWTEGRLLGFFGDSPIETWFNPASPRIKSGEIVPDAIGAAGLIVAMLADPLLIRRPLIVSEGRQCAGFDREPILTLLGPDKDLDKAQGCSRPEAGAPCPAPRDVDPGAEIAFAYHKRTKHRFTAYAPGPETLDWDSQPNPFREFAGAPRVALDLAPDDLATPFGVTAETAHPLSLSALGAMLHLSMGLSAWKEFGPDRWALRCNPSSGNLHPTEAYVFARGVQDVSDGLYHYVSRDHVLERRAETPALSGEAPSLYVGLSSVHWREAWKYGERSFRYCQLDLGHALGSIQTAAAALGWRARLVETLDSGKIAHLLGLDRAADFMGVEGEDADVLIEIIADPGATGTTLPTANEGEWTGAANLLDAHPMYRWPIIGEVSAATRGGGAEEAWERAAYPAALAPAEPKKAAEIILQRRSAQHFTTKYHMPQDIFFGLLDALLARSGSLFNVWTYRPRLHPVFFVHRVEGIEPGLYALPRHRDAETLMRQELSEFDWKPVASAPDHLPLFRLKEIDCRAIARRLFCNQAIGADACFGVAMLSEFEDLVRANAWRYRQLHWEAGLIGQSLYLEAEARGLRGTGVGCFFDDETHERLGLKSQKLQTLYHFTVGQPLADGRIMTLPAYPDRQAVQEQTQ